MTFPKDFIWGSATSSYQIEGAAYHDGGGESIWDMFGRQPGKIHQGVTGDIACDHYNRYRQDIALMADIGLKAYRFSVSWPRIMPTGQGAINQKGLDFYHRLVDELLDNNITPWVSLFHWDFPYDLYCRGGWLNRESSDWFADYTAIVIEQLSDRVQHWITLNEPQCYIELGHASGIHAPGLNLPRREVLLAAHHTLLAHGKAVQVIRARSKLNPMISASQAGTVSIPVSDSEHDIAAAREHMFTVRDKGVFNNCWFSDPMILGHYPEDGVQLYQNDMPRISSGDMEIINQKLDYYGANIYSGRYVHCSEVGVIEEVVKDTIQYTEMNWPITPEALYWGPKFIYDRYRLPIVITENGMANNDVIENGMVDDSKRIDFLQQYLNEYGRVIQDGVPARGYFLWSIMDNFEWAEGYAKRFGIIYVDYENQQRTLKDSAYWYKKLIATND